MSLVLLGVDFRQAPLDVRAALSYDTAAIRALLARARDVPGLQEVAVLSTCNRTEFYLVTAAGSDAATHWLHLLRRDRAQARIADPACVLVRHEGAAAAAHLFAVSTGLSSALLGDVHVGGQVKQAYTLGVDGGTVGPVLHRTFQQALHVAKRVRRETALGRGQVSIGSVVQQLIAHEAPQASRVSLIGTGTVATDVARHLAKRGGLAITIVSRTLQRASDLAAHVGGTAAAFDALEHWLPNADVVIGATATAVPVLTPQMLGQAPGVSGARLVCDLGVPRNVAADVPARLFTIDDIRARRDAALAVREAAVPAAQRLVDEEVAAWDGWRRERALVPAIVALYAREQAQRAAVLARLTPADTAPPPLVETWLRRRGRRHVHRQVSLMRATAARLPIAGLEGARS